MALVSDALVWQCVKGSNSFVRKSRNAQTKRNGAILLSAEPGNLTSQHSFKYSGIANSKVIKFDVDEVDGKGAKGRVAVAFPMNRKSIEMVDGPSGGPRFAPLASEGEADGEFGLLDDDGEAI